MHVASKLSQKINHDLCFFVVVVGFFCFFFIFIFGNLHGAIAAPPHRDASDLFGAASRRGWAEVWESTRQSQGRKAEPAREAFVL